MNTVTISTICTIASVVISMVVMLKNNEKNTRKMFERITRVEDKAEQLEKEFEECKTVRVPKAHCVQLFGKLP